MELIAASHTKRTQRQFHKTRIKNIMAKQDLLLKDFLHGSNVDFIELPIRYERNCDNYIGFVYLASILMYWRVLG